MRHASRFTPHVSRFTHHASRFTLHASRFTPHVSRFTFPVLLLALVAAGCSQQAAKERYLASANKDFAAGQYEKAEIEYLKVLKVAAANPAAISHLGLIYFEQGRYPQAQFLLKKAVDAAPDNADLRLKLCLAETALLQFKDARLQAEKVLQLHPGEPDALSALAETTFTRKDIEDTASQIEKLRRQDKDRAGYHLALGTLALRQGQFTNAAAEFDQAIQMDPKLPGAHTAVASLYWLSNDLQRAETAFKAGADLSPDRSARRLKYADFKLKTGSVDAARKIVEDITARVPDYLPAWNYLGQVAFAEQKFDDCAAILQKVLAKDRVNYEANLLDAGLKITRNQVPAALNQLQRLAGVYTRSPEIQMRLAQAYGLNGEDAKSEVSLRQALALAPGYPDAIIALADLSVKKGDPVSAELALEQLIKRRPDLPQAYLLLAAAYASQRNINEALAVCRRMQPLFNKSPQVPYLIATLLSLQNKRDEARRACDESLALAPDFLPPLEQLVSLDLADNRPDAARERVSREIARRPAVPELQLLLARVYLQQKDYTNAETILLKTVQMAPDLRASYLMLAQLYVTSEKTQEALDKLNAFVAKTNDAPALMQIGLIQESRKDYPAARDAYERLLTYNPKFAAALNNLAYLYSECFNEVDKAVQLAERARTLFPADPAIADTLGWVLYRKGDFPRALSLLTQAAAGLPSEPEVQCHLGMVRYQFGQEGPARLALQSAVQSDKVFPGKDEARTRLSILNLDLNSSDPAVRSKLEKQVAADPGDPIALVRLASLYTRAGDPDQAVKAYQQALSRSPRNAFVLTNLVQLYSAPGRLLNAQKALDYAKEAHAAAPDDSAVSQLLGRLVLQAGDYKWAASLLQDAAAGSPEQPALLYDLARAYCGIGDLAAAETALHGALKDNAGFPQAREAGNLLALLGAYRDPALRPTAAPLAQAALKADANNIPALLLVSLEQREKGSFPECRQTLEKILRLNPLFLPATRDLAILCFERFPGDSATFDLAMKARQAFPDDPGLAKALGVLACRKADYPTASRFLTQSLSSRKDDAELFYYLGLANYHSRSPAEARTNLSHALDLKLPAPLADDARRLLAELK